MTEWSGYYGLNGSDLKPYDTFPSLKEHSKADKKCMQKVKSSITQDKTEFLRKRFVRPQVSRKNNLFIGRKACTSNREEAKENLKKIFQKKGSINRSDLLNNLYVVYGYRLTERAQKNNTLWPKLNLTKVSFKQAVLLMSNIYRLKTADDLKKLFNGSTDSERLKDFNQTFENFGIKELQPKYLGFLHEKLMHKSENAPHEVNISKYHGIEQFAREISYLDPNAVRKGVIVSVMDSDGKVKHYKLKSRLSDHGLHAYYYEPLEAKDDEASVLAFRGTYGPSSVWRDVSLPGKIGKKVFDKNANKIKKMIPSDLRSLKIIGHSLGGVDAQRATLLFHSEYPKMKTTSYMFCAPKLDKGSVAKLNAKRSEDLPKLFYFYHKDDTVTNFLKDSFGKKYLGEDLPSTHFYEFNESNLFSGAPHSIKFFDPDNQKRPTLGDEVKPTLGDKSSRSDSSVELPPADMNSLPF